MGLDVEIPDSPQLTNRGGPSEFESAEEVGGDGDLRRAELEAILQDGAWQEAFAEWAAYSDLTAGDVDRLASAGVFERFDVFWDPGEERLDFAVPPLPDTGAETDTSASTIATELADLGDVLLDVLADMGAGWDQSGVNAPITDEEPFGDEPGE